MAISKMPKKKPANNIKSKPKAKPSTTPRADAASKKAGSRGLNKATGSTHTSKWKGPASEGVANRAKNTKKDLRSVTSAQRKDLASTASKAVAKKAGKAAAVSAVRKIGGQVGMAVNSAMAGFAAGKALRKKTDASSKASSVKGRSPVNEQRTVNKIKSSIKKKKK